MPHKALVGTTVLMTLLALIVTIHGDGQAIAGTTAANVAGTWEGTWMHRVGSGPITLQLAQEGTKVTGKQSVTSVIPVFGERATVKLGAALRGAGSDVWRMDGHWSPRPPLGGWC